MLQALLKQKRFWQLALPAMLLLAISSTAGSSDVAALIKRASQVLGSLPSSMPSAENPITPEKVKLGKILYYESRISIDRTVSCAKCHPIPLYGADGLGKSVGDYCKENPRNAPTVFNAAGQIAEHWVGNRTSVEDQAKQALLGPASFGMHSYEEVEAILRASHEYERLFKAAFPASSEPVTVDNFAMAIGAFERTLVTPGPFDAFLNGNQEALSEQQRKGLEIFLDEGCSSCHFGPYVGGQVYQKFGKFEPYQKYTGSQSVDDGRYSVTKNESDRYVFKVPVLRNVAKTPPYFHDGSVAQLEIAVRIMGKIQLGRDLAQGQVMEIAAFLHSLTGTVPEQAATVPVLP